MTKINKFVYGRKKKSKYAVFYTAHNNATQLQFSRELFNKSAFLCDNFDMIINCNSPAAQEDIKTVAQQFAAKKIVVLCDLVNDGGYLMGAAEQTANSFEDLLGYEAVLHLHPDVYIISDHGMRAFISEFAKTPPEERCDYYTFPMHPTRGLAPGLVYEESILVECIDFSQWVGANFVKDDYIIMKMDIEGSEYKVLPKMIKDNTIQYIDELIIEWHSGMVLGYEDLHAKLKKEISDLGVLVQDWR